MICKTYRPREAECQAVRAEMGGEPVYVVAMEGALKAVHAKAFEALYEEIPAVEPYLAGGPSPKRLREPISVEAKLDPIPMMKSAPSQDRALEVLRSVYPEGLTPAEAGDRLYPDRDRTKQYQNSLAVLKGLRDRGLAELRECPDTRLTKWFAVEVKR
jgi:hypothetical protein